LHTVKIISIGDELLNNNKLNSTAPFMAQTLTKNGFKVTSLITIGDEIQTISHQIRSANESILIITGGLGPTEDDITVPAVACAMGVSLTTDAKYLKFLKLILKKKQLPKTFLNQARLPQGFKIEKNKYGSAPFLYYQKKSTKKFIFLLPGVPRECIFLFTKKIIPILKKNFSQSKIYYQQEIKIINIGESLVEKQIRTLLHQDTVKYSKTKTEPIKISYLPNYGELIVCLKSYDKKNLRRLGKKIINSFTNHIVYMSDKINTPVKSLGQILHETFIKKNLKIGFVESCSGGLLTSYFVNFFGASTYLDSGIITYSNKSKILLANIKPNSLKQHGAVSKTIAQEMAVGYAGKRKLNLCLSTTGIAGPGGGSKDKPVGLVYLGLYFKEPHTLKPVIITRSFLFQKQRSYVREKTVNQALIFMSEILFKKSNN
jgi:nicotinamide-nucleotide amidase